MEKKNTILLTVIAIATLLVAVVGATFAYFTATVTTDNPNENTAKVTTYTLASAKMDMGSKLDINGVYPGYKDVKSVTVKGDCTAADGVCQNVNTVISVTQAIDAEFNNDITWTLYKSATPITCNNTNTAVTTGGQYYDTATCDIPDTATSVLSSSSTPSAGNANKFDLDVSVSQTTNDNYYLVLEYRNDPDADQNTQQGHSATITIDFAAKQ